MAIKFYQGGIEDLTSSSSAMNNGDLAIATDEMQWYLKYNNTLSPLGIAKADEAYELATSLIEDANEAVAAANDATNAANDAADAANNAASDANEATEAANDAASDANEAAEVANDAASDASAAATDANNAASSATSAAAAANTAAQNADSRVTTLENVVSHEVTEDIYSSLTWTDGYMGPTGVPGTSDTLAYSDKINVKPGNKLELNAVSSAAFRFVTAYNGNTAVADSGSQNVANYTVPSSIDCVVVTIYKTAQNVKINKTFDDFLYSKDLESDIENIKSSLGEMNNLKHQIKDIALYVFGYFSSTTLQYWKQTAQTIFYFPCTENVEYTIKKTMETPTFDICYVNNEPEKGVQQPVYNYMHYAGNYTDDISFTTGTGAKYILMLVGILEFNDLQPIVRDSISILSYQYASIDDVARSIITYDDAYFPQNIYMIKNKFYEMYNTQLCPNAENYTFKWEFGTNYGNRTLFGLSNARDYILLTNIYNADGTLAKTAGIVDHVVDIVSGNINLLTFGDSLTNHCIWQAELMNMANNITCVGSRSRDVKNSNDVTVTVYDEGRAGFTTANYLNGTSYANQLSDSGGVETPNNRWYDPVNEVFSTAYYFNNHFPQDQTEPDVITVFLGMNDLMSTATIDQIVANIKFIVDDMLSYNSNFKIIVMTPQLRYLPSITGQEQKRFMDYAHAIDDTFLPYSNVITLPLFIGMDSENNYSTTSVTINTRNPETEQFAGDPTHPAKYGYWQIADWVLAAISYICQA